MATAGPNIQAAVGSIVDVVVRWDGTGILGALATGIEAFLHILTFGA
ncbi:MAG: hypothetical protein GY906_21695 [bacterium]|nr:hypothetical protein [bacterium]